MPGHLHMVLDFLVYETVYSTVAENCPPCPLYPPSGTDYTKHHRHSQRRHHGPKLMLSENGKKREKESLVYMTEEKKKKEKGKEEIWKDLRTLKWNVAEKKNGMIVIVRPRGDNLAHGHVPLFETADLNRPSKTSSWINGTMISRA